MRQAETVRVTKIPDARIGANEVHDDAFANDAVVIAIPFFVEVHFVPQGPIVPEIRQQLRLPTMQQLPIEPDGAPVRQSSMGVIKCLKCRPKRGGVLLHASRPNSFFEKRSLR